MCRSRTATAAGESRVERGSPDDDTARTRQGHRVRDRDERCHHDHAAYDLSLVSRTDTAHVRCVKFYYPQDIVQQANGGFRGNAARRKQDQETAIARLSHAAADSLNFDYQIDGDGVPRKPVRVFDDGTRAYIQMPAARGHNG